MYGTRMVEITIRVGERKVTVEVSEDEARKILNDLIFQSTQDSEQAIGEIEATVGSKDEINIEPDEDHGNISGSDFLEIPTEIEIRAFIESQPNYKHSVESIAHHFAHRKVTGAEGRAAEPSGGKILLGPTPGRGHRSDDRRART